MSDKKTPTVVLPYSKSMAARAMVLDFINGGNGEIPNLPECEDTVQLKKALSALSSLYQTQADFPDMSFHLGSGGTSLRFFTALAASLPGFKYVVDCSCQLRKRPFSPLVDALREAGARIEYVLEEGQAPIRIQGAKLNGANLNLDSSVSSQFASALLLVSQLWESPFKAHYDRDPISWPYIAMTEKMAEAAAKGQPLAIETDWSAAAFFYEWAMLNPGKPVRFASLTPPGKSVQGDARTAEIFAGLGVNTEYLPDGSAVITGTGKHPQFYEADLRDVPDLVPALAISLCAAGVRFSFTGIEHLRHKESDRIEALATELGKAGFILFFNGNALSWGGFVKGNGPCVYQSHDDHRMAMSLMMGLDKIGAPRSRLIGLESVSKSFPDFLEQRKALVSAYRNQD